ncbi:MAG: C10 family peptidase [Bacteroidaceae bacterium]|nr:C10 family peptidase [Bacteroidaceae bacterium]
MNYKKTLCICTCILLLNVHVRAEIITKDSAAIVAKNFMESMGFRNKKLVPFNFHVTKTRVNTQSIEPPAYHIYHGENNEGFVIVSGDNIAKPILGYSFDTIISDSTSNFPPAMEEWLEEMEEQILWARKQGFEQSAEVAQEWKTPKYGSVVVRMKTALWDQGDPFNQQCPLERGKRCVTGCTATAYAILMKYYGYPTIGRGKTQEYVCEESGIHVAPRNLEHNYQWNMMPLEYKRGQYSQQEANSVSQLMADIGVAIQSDYSVEGTSAYLGRNDIFVHFGYNPGTRMKKKDYTANEWHSMLCAELELARPVIYRGSSSPDKGGHAFIIDGYTNQNEFFINWGWGGSYNGAFLLNALTPGGDDFRSDQEAYFDCVPASELPVVAKVGEIGCPSLKTAIALAPQDGEPTLITMQQNTEINYEEICENQNIQLDLNGYTINIEDYGIYNRGTLHIIDSKGMGKMNIKTGNNSIINNYGFLIIEGGEFYNLVQINTEETDYRRCIWTAEETTTHITGGKFIGVNQVLCTHGEFTISNGEFTCTNNGSVVSNFGKTGTLSINGGTFENSLSTVGGNDYRRCVWTSEGTNTLINGGEYISSSQVLCFNGDATIENGNFECTGNSEVVANYNTMGILTINGGFFENTSTGIEEKDYRRCVWTNNGTITYINGGSFINKSNSQTLCFNGDAVITNGVIENKGRGIGCISNGNVKITDCMLCANQILYMVNGAILKCSGGFYSQKVGDEYLEKGYKCISNNGLNSLKYPFKINNETGIDAIENDGVINDVYYDLNGKRHTKTQKGVNIIRKPNGKSVKILYK